MKRQEYDHSKLRGTNVCIETSLKEYGFAWIECENEYLFYHGIAVNAVNDELEWERFNFCSLNKNIDIKKEFNWIDWEEVCSYVGLELDDFLKQDLPYILYDLNLYYGYENIFGSTYWEGLTYNDIVKENKNIK